MNDEIIVYQADELSTRLEVRIEEETIWLTQAQIVILFDSSKANVSEHIKNIFQSGELEKKTTVRKIRTVQIEGGRSISRDLTHYNLGASLKDLGKKWFAFSKIEIDAKVLIDKLKQNV